MTPSAPARVERFRRDVEALAEQVPSPERPLALAVSGGPDSMAMLALAAAAWPGALVAATVDHRLRAGSADEALMVADRCRSLGIAHATLHPPHPIAGSSLQARAREARYALLLGWALERGAPALATAHQMEDQAETFLMRAARGSSVAGLGGIRARRPLADVQGRAVLLVRPLLGWRRAELRAIATAAGPFVDDPGNADPVHDRSRFRAMLAAHPDLDIAGVASAAAHAAEAQAALDEVVDLVWTGRATVSGDRVTVALQELGRELRRRLVRRAIGHLLGRPFDAANVEPLLDALAAGRGASQAGVMVAIRRGVATFRPAPPRRSH